jgi:hypothetical protein
VGYDNIFVGDKGCDNVVAFIKIYPISFVYTFKLEKYINRWKNGLDSLYASYKHNACAIWDDCIKKACPQQNK